MGVLGESPVYGDHPPDEVSAGNLTSAETGCLEVHGRATRKREEEKRKQRFPSLRPKDPEERRRDLPGKAQKVSGNRREAANWTRYKI